MKSEDGFFVIEMMGGAQIIWSPVGWGIVFFIQGAIAECNLLFGACRQMVKVQI